MTPPATVQRPSGQRGAPPPGPPPVVVPFVGASHEFTLPAFTWSVTPGAAAVDSPEFELPAGGYLRHLLLEVDAQGSGTLGPGTLGPDYPFNLFSSISLYDVNGAPIFGPMDGFAVLIANCFGGYAYAQDPRSAYDYDGTFKAKFHLRIPVEISHSDGMGAISNQSAAAEYKVRLSVRPASQLYPVAPTTAPTFNVRGFLEAWTVPDTADIAGRPQQQKPPLHGISQFWSARRESTIAGELPPLRLTRVGSLIRALVFICRDVNGVRTDTAFPDPFRFSWDNRDLRNQSRLSLRNENAEKFTNPPDDLAGCYAFLYNHAEKNAIGDGPPALWLGTVQSSKLELSGTIATPGSVQILTNDVSPLEVEPGQRYIETSRTGLVPDVGRPAATPAGVA